MKLREKCSHCGTIIQSYSHSLNKPLVEALRQLLDHYSNGGQTANLQKDLKLTKNQYNNFQKLQYFGLAKRSSSYKDAGAPKNYGWIPTDKALAFITGEIAISDKAMTFGGEVVLPPHKAWSGVKISKKYVYQIDESSWKKIDDFRVE